jgi:hypothetical protein
MVERETNSIPLTHKYMTLPLTHKYVKVLFPGLVSKVQYKYDPTIFHKFVYIATFLSKRFKYLVIM